MTKSKDISETKNKSLKLSDTEQNTILAATIDVKVINFNANDWTMESLCRALNSDEIEN